jgi:hypothetical protein
MRLSVPTLALVISLSLMPKVNAATVKAPVKAAACPVTDLDYDDSVDVKAIDNYVFAIGELLRHEKFREIDCIADAARVHQTRFASGMWKIHKLYAGLVNPPLHPTQIDWRNHIALLKKWIAQRPQSITARVGLAWAYNGYAWDARGNGYNDSVSNSGWQLFQQRMSLAKATLEEASRLKAKCPEWYAAMQEVAKAQAWDREKAQALFQQAITAYPDYDAYYVYYFEYLLPKWHGKEGEAEEFVGQSADRLGGGKGDRLYFRIAAYLACRCEHPPTMNMSWQRIQSGFAATDRQYGHSLTNENKYAFLANTFNDFLVADSMFQVIGDQWDEKTWRAREYFEQIRTTARFIAERSSRAKNANDEAEANQHELDGAVYQKKMQEAADKLVQNCMKTGVADRTRFTMTLKIRQDGGIMDTVHGDHTTPMVECFLLALRAVQLHQEKPFPIPPHDKYWVKIEVDPETLAASANR